MIAVLNPKLHVTLWTLNCLKDSGTATLIIPDCINDIPASKLP